MATDAAGTIRFCNQAGERLFGWRRREAIGHAVTDSLPAFQDLPEGVVVETSAPHAKGARFPVELVLARVPLAEENLSPFKIAVVRAASERGVEDIRLDVVLFETVHDGVIVCEADRRVMAANPAFETMSGWSNDALQGVEPRLLLGGGDSGDMWRVLDEEDGRWRQDTWLRRRDGDDIPVHVTAVVLRDEERRSYGYLVLLNDRLAGEGAGEDHACRHPSRAGYDSLTGLPNHMLFLDRLAQTVWEATRSGQRVGLVSVAIDGLAAIEATRGAEAVVRVIREVAERLTLGMRPYDTVARLKDNRFALVMPNLGVPHNAGIVGQRVLKALARPFFPGEEAESEMPVRARLGIALYPDDAPDTDSLLCEAEEAVSRAEEGGCCFYNSELNAEAQDRIVLWHELDATIARGKFHIYYQPSIEAHNGQVTAVEALMRWKSVTLGTVLPSRFIPAIEEAGRMEDLGLWLVEEVCLQQVAWRLAALRMSINLSDRQMRHPRFLAAVRAILAKTGADPHRLEFEISEDMLVHDTESCVATLWELREMGIGLVVDDFGSGVTSLHNLRRFPIRSVKVDSRYVRELEQDAEALAPLNAIVGMSHSLGLPVIAKGVETGRELEQVRACRCDEAQGFLICPPLPAEEILRRVEAGPLFPLTSLSP